MRHAPPLPPSEPRTRTCAGCGPGCEPRGWHPRDPTQAGGHRAGGHRALAVFQSACALPPGESLPDGRGRREAVQKGRIQVWPGFCPVQSGDSFIDTSGALSGHAPSCRRSLSGPVAAAAWVASVSAAGRSPAGAELTVDRGSRDSREAERWVTQRDDQTVVGVWPLRPGMETVTGPAETRDKVLTRCVSEEEVVREERSRAQGAAAMQPLSFLP